MFKKIKNKTKLYFKSFSVSTFIFLLVLPASSNYKLDSYGFGNGGVSDATSAGYAINGISGEMSAGKLSGTSYKLGSGLSFVNQANVPTAPTFTNPSNYYNKLHLIINTANNASDAKFAVAISTDNFATTNYVKSDNTIGATLVAGDYRIYASWNGSTGIDVIGLDPGTTYQVKAKVIQGKFTETGYGPTASASTVNPTLSFGITTDTQSSPPFSMAFGSMNTGSVNTGPSKIWVSLETNATNGGKVYVSGANGGLSSASSSYQINAVTGDLSSLSEGFGIQGFSVGETSGGPFALASIYNQAGNIVGIADQTLREIFYTNSPIIGGTGSVQLKVRPNTTARPASDYAETLTMVAAGNF